LIDPVDGSPRPQQWSAAARAGTLRIAVIVSVLLHSLILSGALFLFHSQRDMLLPPEIGVAMVFVPS
jgi:hypothetical protein